MNDPFRVRASRLQRGNTIRVEGSKGAYVWDLKSAKLMGRRHDEAQYTEAPVPDSITSGTMVTQFLANIRDDTNLPPTFYDGLRAQEVIDAVVRSTEERRWVEVR